MPDNCRIEMSEESSWVRPPAMLLEAWKAARAHALTLTINSAEANRLLHDLDRLRDDEADG